MLPDSNIFSTFCIMNSVVLKSLPSSVALFWASLLAWYVSIMSDSLWPPWWLSTVAGQQLVDGWYTTGRGCPTKAFILSIHYVLGCPRLLEPSIFPCIMTFSRQLFWRLAVCPKQLRAWLLMKLEQSVLHTNFLQNTVIGSFCRPWNFKHFTPAPEFKSNDSIIVCLIKRPTLTSICGNGKCHLILA